MKPVLLCCLFHFCITVAEAQCYSTAFNDGTSFSTDNSIGVYNFSSPGNAQASDNSRANASSLIAILTGDTYYLKATGFNFSIPSYASICGITVEVECRATGLLLTAAVRDNEVKLIKGAVITGNNYALTGDWGSTDAYNSYGGTTDLWGTTLTPADVNASNFGVAFSARIIALVAVLPSAQIDHIRMKITYNPILPVHLLYFNAISKNKRIALEWKTTEEEDNAFIILQRSFNSIDWLDINRYELSANNNDKVYLYEDVPDQGGKYAYRLKISSASGAITYSAVRYATMDEMKTLSVYPNPGGDFITLSLPQPAGHIAIIDMYARRWPVVYEKTSANSCRIDIRNLSKGIYFIQGGSQVIKFLKE